MIETTLSNGTQVVCETTPFFRSVSFGVWVIAGARDENPEKSGLFHFLEHMAFKGAPGRDAAAIAMEIDALGGHIDAFTSREVTCFSGHVLSDRLDEAFELVAEIMLKGDFPEEELARERRVILEEIRMGEDNPSDYIHDRLYPAIWEGHPLGRPITGESGTVANLGRDDLLSARDRFYRPPGIIVTACGSIQPKRLVGLVERHFGAMKPGVTERDSRPPANRAGVKILKRPLEQTSIIAAVPGLAMNDPRRHALYVLNMVLGGGVSSRLFQRAREERGLAYSIYSFYDQYSDGGLFGVYAACEPAALGPLWETIRAELGAIVSSPPTEAEVARAKTMGAGNLKMSFESLSSRMYQMAQQKIYHKRILSLPEMIKELDAVTAADTAALAEELLGGENYTILALGPVTEESEKRIRG